jgi:uncharacterized membrane protein YhaH (DUF805 family)
MNLILLSIFQFASPAAIGVLVMLYLRGVTQRLLVDLCGTVGRADFWVRVTSVLMATAPLALVLLAAQSPLRCMPGDAACALNVLRQTIIFSLVGILISVAIVARAVGRYVPREPHIPVVQRAKE